MDPEKIAFLFEEVPAGFDPDHRVDRAELLANQFDTGVATMAEPARLVAVTEQVATGEPPEVWRTATRLVACGLDRTELMHQLALATGPQPGSCSTASTWVPATTSPHWRGCQFRPAPRWRTRCSPRPASTSPSTTTTWWRSRRSGSASPPTTRWCSACSTGWSTGSARTTGRGDAGDRHGARRVAHRGVGGHPSTVGGRAACRDAHGRVDLAAFGHRTELWLPGGEPLMPAEDADQMITWFGPDGWLGGFADGDLLAVRVDAAGSWH